MNRAIEQRETAGMKKEGDIRTDPAKTPKEKDNGTRSSSMINLRAGFNGSEFGRVQIVRLSSGSNSA